MSSTPIVCPSWHFLPGPYQDDPERKNCERADTHKDQRTAWEQRNSLKRFG